MATKEEETHDRPKKTRSPSYPADGLETCVKWARQIYDAEKRATVHASIAVRHMGYSSMSGAARSGLSALKKFTLLSDDGGERVKISDVAVRLFLAPDEQKRISLLRELAVKPDIFRELFAQYPDGLPSNENLKYSLVADRGFGEEAANVLLRALRETVRFANLEVQSSQLSQPESGPVQNRDAIEDSSGQVASHVESVSVTASTFATSSAPVLHVWSLGGGAVVELRCNKQLTLRQFRRLVQYVELAAEAETDDVGIDDVDV